MLNVKLIDQILIADIMLKPSEAPHKIKTRLNVSGLVNQVLLIDLSNGIKEGKIIRLNLSKISNSSIKWAYIQIRSLIKPIKLKTLTGKYWYVFNQERVSKAKLFVKEYRKSINEICSVMPVNLKIINGRGYFDLFIRWKKFKNENSIILPHFAAKNKDVSIKFNRKEIENSDSFTKRISGVYLNENQLIKESFLTFHYF